MPLNLTLDPEKKPSSAPLLKRGLDHRSREGMNTRIFFLCIFIFQLLPIFQGIEFSDEGFLAVFYQQIFRNPVSVQYNFMFWLTGIIGGAYLKMFSFLGLWGLRFAGVLVTTGTAMLTYSLLRRYLHHNYLKLGLFLIIITLNNDVKELNYNNLSALFNVVIVLFMFRGLKAQKNGLLFISGLFTSLSFFIRPPNILDLGLLAAVAYYGYLHQKTLQLVITQMLSFIAGFLSCSALVLFVIHACGHWDIYMNAFRVLYKMGKETPQVNIQKSDYGVFRLIHLLRSNVLKAILFSTCLLAALLAIVSGFSLLKQKLPALRSAGKPLAFGLLLLVFYGIYRGAIDQYFILYIFSGITLVVFALSLLSPADKDIRFLLACGSFIVVSYPFASSAGILTAGRYTYWIGFPVAIDFLFRIPFVNRQFNPGRRSTGRPIRFHITEPEMKAAKNIFVACLIFTGLFFSYRYPFFDWHNRTHMHYPVHNKMLAGIYTTQARARTLDDLLNESAKYIKKGDCVLAYDCIPLFHFVTETVPYLRSPYPWLYESDIFKDELDLARQQKNKLPVVVMQTIQTIGNGSKWPEEIYGDYSKWDLNQERNAYMADFLRANHYREVWADGYFKILIPNPK